MEYWSSLGQESLEFCQTNNLRFHWIPWIPLDTAHIWPSKIFLPTQNWTLDLEISPATGTVNHYTMQSWHSILLVHLDTIPSGCVWQSIICRSSPWHPSSTTAPPSPPQRQPHNITTKKRGQMTIASFGPLVSTFLFFCFITFNWLSFSLMIDFLI